MEITYTLSEREYLAANRAHVMHIFCNGSGLIFPFLLGLAFAAFVFFNLDRYELQVRLMTALILMLGIAAAVWLIVVALTWLTTPGRVRHLYQQQRLLREETRARWDADRFETASESATSRVPWGDFVRWIETDQALLLFPNDMLMYTLPKRVMDTATRDDLVSRLEASGSPRWRMWRSLGKPVRKPG